MKYSITIILTVIIAGLCAMPPWEITVYPTSTVAYGNVTIDGVPAQQGDIVYAFVRHECRGKQPVKIYEGKAYLTMNIQGLENHEPVYFKIWDASADSLYEVNYTTHTKPNGDLGYPPDVLPINGVSEGVTYFFPPESLEMHPFEQRELNIGYYCNTVAEIATIKVYGAKNLEVVPEGLNISFYTKSAWTGEEDIEIELLNKNQEVIEYGTVQIIVKTR